MSSLIIYTFSMCWEFTKENDKIENDENKKNNLISGLLSIFNRTQETFSLFSFSISLPLFFLQSKQTLTGKRFLLFGCMSKLAYELFSFFIFHHFHPLSFIYVILVNIFPIFQLLSELMFVCLR